MTVDAVGVRGLLPLVLPFASLLSACALLAPQPCGCGQSYERDPWTDAPLSVGPTHDIAVHCRCRCGDGPEVLEDPSARCEDYEGDCLTAAGEEAAYVCE